MRDDGVTDTEAARFPQAVVELGHTADLTARPSSPNASVPGGNGRLVWADAIASAIARSMAGSATFTPPATLTNTSSAARRSSARFSSTAMIIATRSELTPDTFRLGRADHAGRGQRLHLDQQHPAALHGGGDDAAAGLTGLAVGARAVLFQEQVAGVADFGQALAGHLEQADLVGRPEAVLDAADDAVGVKAIALEVDDGIDDVLDDLGPGQRAGLGDVADDDDGGAGRLAR